MTTALRPKPSVSRNAKATPNRFDLDPPTTGSARSKWPEVTVGLLVLAVFALVATWFYSSTSDREPVLALRAPIERGQTLTSGDLMVVDIAAEPTVNAVSADQAAALVGQVALVDLSPGTLAVGDLFADRAAIADGDGVVGLALDPGEYPTVNLAPGDWVRIVATADTNADGEAVLVEAAEIVDVVPIGVGNQLFVSVAMTTTAADQVTSAAAADRVRLVQVAGS